MKCLRERSGRARSPSLENRGHRPGRIYLTTKYSYEVFGLTSSSASTMASADQQSDLPAMVALVKTMTNPQLKAILKNESLAVSGVKATLQIRIISRKSCLLILHFCICSPHESSGGQVVFAGSSMLTAHFCHPTDMETLLQEGNVLRVDRLKRLLYTVTGKTPPGSSTTQQSSYPQYHPHAVSNSLPTPSGSPLGGPMLSTPIFTSGVY